MRRKTVNFHLWGWCERMAVPLLSLLKPFAEKTPLYWKEKNNCAKAIYFTKQKKFYVLEFVPFLVRDIVLFKRFLKKNRRIFCSSLFLFILVLISLWQCSSKQPQTRWMQVGIRICKSCEGLNRILVLYSFWFQLLFSQYFHKFLESITSSLLAPLPREPGQWRPW